MKVPLVILCSALIAFSGAALAKPPQPRAKSGTVPSPERADPTAGDQRCVGSVGRVDQRARALRVQRYGAMLPMNLVWNSRTTFLEGSRPVTAARLNKGDLVTVWYRSPIIGRPIASQVVIARAVAHASQQGRRRR